jgi:predicted nucleic acid-binding protein
VTDYVIDASVAVKWVVEEDGTDAAVALLAHNLFAPDFMLVECANILWKKHRRGELTQDEALLAASVLAGSEVAFTSARPLMEPAARLAMALGHPAYDCLYLALAQSRGCSLVTADAKLAALPHATMNVTLLHQFPVPGP